MVASWLHLHAKRVAQVAPKTKRPQAAQRLGPFCLRLNGVIAMTEGLQRSCPPALTGGESPEKSIFGVVVDWLTFTFLPAPDELVPRQFFDWLNSNLIKKVQAIDVPGMLGYEFGVKFFVMLDDGKEHHIGRLDWGGSFHKQRARFDLSGSGCALVKDWAAMQDFVGTFFDWSLTRVDLAADFIDGEYIRPF
jgi:phage replication initiation protein